MKQHCPQFTASADRAINRANCAVSASDAVSASRPFILSHDFLARTLVLGLLLISILR